MDEVTLVAVDATNWERICCLNPGREGREFVASNAFSIAQSVFEPGWIIRGIAVGSRLVGFTMFGFCAETQSYELCRLMIDEQEQGKGYGQRALRLILAEMRRRWACARICLSTAPENRRGKHIYEAAGFRATGETCGEGEDLEEVFCLAADAEP